ncbi:ATP synthase F1 subunit delta [Ureaplasma sp. ES3154-GEN]|uniref:ATP synthase F1 subunit delta n=1 Tax=Ureaplasma sp. ES3154-GEN TaxID=2984844 RepID=UPI0021E961A7|nr:ATP synthase F1 subunit delta [Ureaplasma sp. ES3154-GEN]MCV3743384.1 ATP synthase F1 subunit delta [Ureaplasma sp. ES3154-GEN]
MKSIRSVQKYAYALFEIASEEQKLRTYKEQTEVLLEISYLYPVFYNDLINKTIDKAKRKSILMSILGDKFDYTFLNFISLIIDRDKGNYLRSILKKVLKLINNGLQIRRVVIHSALELTEQQVNSIKEAMGKKYNCEIEAELRVDPKMIGGIRVNFESFEIDGSLQTRLSQIIFENQA